MVDETENRSKISIWWDIENCHVPKDVDPHYIAQNITAALQRASLSGPIEIQVFGDTNILPHSTQKALSDTGITLNHVPRGNKDAADKAILVGLLLWALDNPPPANILLISGDGDFANALHRLRLKTYSILLAVPAQFVKPALTGAAKKLWFWKDMAKGQLAEPKLSQASGDTSSQGTAGASCAMDVFQQKQGPSSTIISTRCTAVPNGYSSPQKRVAQSGMGSISEPFRSLSLENHPSSFSSPGMSSDKSKKAQVMENAHHTPLDRKIAPGGASNNSSFPASNRLNASESQRGSSNSTARSMDFGHYPYFLPQAGGSLNSVPSCAPCNTTGELKLPQFCSLPAGLPRGPFKHITPNNNRGAIHELSVNNTVSGNKLDQGNKSNTFEYRNDSNVIPSSSQLTTSIPPSNAMVSNPSNPEKVSHNASLDKIYCAMKTLERDMLAPTESNLSDCIQYWDSQHERVDVKQVLKMAAELQQVTKTQLRGGLVMFFPPDHRVPWNCVDPGNMQHNHSGDVWLELQQFLLYSEKKQAFSSSASRYDAALILKNSCGMHIQSLVVGQILNLVQQAMQEKKWLRKNGPGWAPLVLNQKVLLEWSGDEAQKGDSRPSTNHYPSRIWKPAVQHSYTEQAPDKDATLSKIRAILYKVLKENTRYDLSLLPNDFQHATGFPLNHQKLGYANLQELIKEFTDVAFVEATNSDRFFLYPIKINENTVGLVHNVMADKENDEKALRQIQVVRELKQWLSFVMTTVKDGYDISKIQQDFLQASGKDLNREGLDFNKLQCILKQFSDVIHIARSSGGLWLAYPASHGVGIGVRGARSAVVLTS